MTFVPENELEKAMLLAASQEAARPRFYHLLMEAELFVLGEKGASEEREAQHISEGISLDTIVNQGKSYHAVFTSAARMTGFAGSGMAHFRMPGRILFSGTRGASFVVNPGSELNKILAPEEIAYWLAESQKASRSATLSVGKPKVVPRKLVKALCVLFINRSQIASAHLGYAAYDGPNQEPFPLIGLVADGDAPRLVREIFEAAAAALPGKRIDVVHIDPLGPMNPLQKHLLSIAPFFRRAPATTIN